MAKFSEPPVDCTSSGALVMLKIPALVGVQFTCWHRIYEHMIILLYYNVTVCTHVASEMKYVNFIDFFIFIFIYYNIVFID